MLETATKIRTLSPKDKKNKSIIIQILRFIFVSQRLISTHLTFSFPRVWNSHAWTFFKTKNQDTKIQCWETNYSLEDLLMSDLWMCGITPPPAMVPLIRVSSSSSPRMASCKCLGVIRFTFKSLLAFPANSNTSAVKYSNIAAV